MIKRNISIENAIIGFRNFSGKEGQYNPEGRRIFSVFLEEDIAEQLKEDGWNVKLLKPKNPEDPPKYHLPVGVNFNKFPPRIVLIRANTKSDIDEDTVHILDWAEIEHVDLIIRPYNWDVNGRTGVRAYLKAMYITIVEDEFEAKYRNVPDSAYNTVGNDDDPPPWD